jgi:Fe-S cluster biogenesis protein NfuA/nitrite reductase/ring-hydroxylating ferredoxin subunit
MATEAGPGELLDRVQALSAQIDELEDVRARELAQELVGAVIAMYGDGLRRIVEAIVASRPVGATILDQLSQDGAVASLLLIHDLYPVSLEERVIEALDTVRPYMESHGGNVELLGIEAGVAKLALQGSCNGCAASRATLELAIKQALDEHAPDLAGLEVEGVPEPAPNGAALPMAQASGNGSFELPLIHSSVGALPLADERPPRWVSLQDLDDVASGEVRTATVDGVELLLANVDGSLLAYLDQCASCGGAIHDGELIGHMLRCPGCLVEFDLPRAGRAAGGEPLQLTPVPLLQTGGLRVAV